MLTPLNIRSVCSCLPLKAFVATGTNLSLQFFPANLLGEQRQVPTRDYVDFERETGKVRPGAGYPKNSRGPCALTSAVDEVTDFNIRLKSSWRGGGVGGGWGRQALTWLFDSFDTHILKNGETHVYVCSFAFCSSFMLWSENGRPDNQGHKAKPAEQAAKTSGRSSCRSGRDPL